MSTFTIDFFELAFLAEACIPPRPIARAMFWQNLTKIYWADMSEDERAHLYEWMNRNDLYKESVATEEDAKIFHARFDPDNQYMIKVKMDDHEQEYRAFKRWISEEEGVTSRYYVEHDMYIPNEYIVEINEFKPKK